MADRLLLESSAVDGYLLEDGSGVLRMEDPPAYYDAVRADNPVAYWRLGEGSGTVAADTVGTNPGTYTGGYTLGQTGALTGDPDAAVLLDGVNGSYVLGRPSAILAGLTNWTIEAWVKSSTPANDKAIYCERGVAGNDILKVQLTTVGTVQLVYRNDASAIVFEPTSVATVDNNQPHHVVLTKAGTVGKIYIDGSQSGADGAVTPSDTLTDTISARIGGDAQDANAYWAGNLDEVALYNVTLTAQQVATHYAARGVNRLVSYVNPMPAFIAQ